MSKMNKALKKEWIEALLNGNYAQTRQTLHNNKGYCCLGVLCAVAGIMKGNRAIMGDEKLRRTLPLSFCRLVNISG